MTITESTLTERLKVAANRSPLSKLTAYSRRGDIENMSISELMVKANRFAAGMVELGVQGQAIGLGLSNSLGFFVSLVGCLQAQVIAVPLPSSKRNAMEAHRRKEIIESARLRLVITNNPSSKSELSIDDIMSAGGSKNSLKNPAPDTPAIIQYTSGSISNPKGVLLTQNNLAANSKAIAEHINAGSHDKLDTWLPLYHDMGLVSSLGALCCNTELRFCKPEVFLVDPLGWLIRFANNSSTISIGPHFFYKSLCQAYESERATQLDLSNWRIAFNGAEPIVPADLEDFFSTYADHGFDPNAMYPVYGLAESTLAVTFPDVSSPLRFANHENQRFVSVGKPIGGMRIKIGGLHKGKSSENQINVGEIRIKGPSLMAGYMNANGVLEKPFASDGWFSTGDIGFQLNGDLFMCGRAKEMIIVRGKNFFPHEIETAALAYAEVARLAASVAAIEDNDRNEIVLLMEFRKHSGEKLNGLLSSLEKYLTSFFGVSIQTVCVRKGTIPKTTSGKIRRKFLTKQWSANGSF